MLGDFAKRLKEIRTSMNLTMSEFSDLGDVGATTQGAYEKESDDERRYPDVRYLLNLKSHGVDIHYLLTGEKSPDNVISPQTLEIINAYENADEDHKAIFEATAKACAVKPKGRVDKKKDDQDPPKSSAKQKIGNINASGGTVGDIMNDSVKNTIHNNFSTNDNPRKTLIKRMGDFIALIITVLSAVYFIDLSSLHSMNPTELTLTIPIIFAVGLFLFKVCAFPIHYEVDLWYYKRDNTKQL